MSTAKALDLGLKTAYDELFMDDKGRENNRSDKIYSLPLKLIDDFPDHPYHVRLDEDMTQLVQSVKERGIITPVIVIPKEGGRYLMVSGHRRKKACELAGLETIKADIKEMTLDEAIMLMVDSNLQRTTILPSEKAFAYKMRLEAMNRQGQRTDLTSVPLAQKLTSREALGKEVGESQDQVRRYVRLTNLIPNLLNLVDDGKIALRPAVELSYLTKGEQEDLAETISYEEATPSHAQAKKLRKFSENGQLNEDVILSIMCEQKPNQREKYSFHADTLRPYLPSNLPRNQTESYVLKALEYYKRYLDRKRENAR